MIDTNLKTRFATQYSGELAAQLGLKNALSSPRLQKIIINVGIPKSDTSAKDIEVVKNELALITGQSPKISGAKFSRLPDVPYKYIEERNESQAIQFGAVVTRGLGDVRRRLLIRDRPGGLFPSRGFGANILAHWTHRTRRRRKWPTPNRLPGYHTVSSRHS